MNRLCFAGRLAREVNLVGEGNRAVCKFTLIRNEYVGRDEESGERHEKQVALQFTAFRAKAEAIARHAVVGDQLLIEARIENNSWTDNEGQTHYEYDYVVNEFDFGAPGSAKREMLSHRAVYTLKRGVHSDG